MHRATHCNRCRKVGTAERLRYEWVFGHIDDVAGNRWVGCTTECSRTAASCTPSRATNSSGPGSTSAFLYSARRGEQTGADRRFDASDDFPSAALRNLEQGITGARYTIWTDGLVRDCYITKSSGSASLDYTTCALIQNRYRFKPAMDAKGKPIPITDNVSIRWQYPVETQSYAPYTETIQITVDSSGLVSGCSANINGPE